jgi:hypothetical protein
MRFVTHSNFREAGIPFRRFNDEVPILHDADRDAWHPRCMRRPPYMFTSRNRRVAVIAVFLAIPAALAIVWPQRWLFLFTSRGLWGLVLVVAILVVLYQQDRK